MPPGRFTQRRRTPGQVRSDERADQLAGFLDRALKDGRSSAALTQREAATRSGLSQSQWSGLERGHGANVSLRVWVRATGSVDADLRAYLERASGARGPRDAVHLRHQELVARIARGGGWSSSPETSISGAGFADLVLTRPNELALIEIWDWFDDVGDAFRSWDRKRERIGAAGQARVSGCWVVRATRRNRELVGAHGTLFAARFPASAREWLRAIGEPRRAMPDLPGLLWITVRGDRLFPARLGTRARERAR
jgi:transcriptional regulator with XRE-family HTH domain